MIDRKIVNPEAYWKARSERLQDWCERMLALIDYYDVARAPEHDSTCDITMGGVECDCYAREQVKDFTKLLEEFEI